jgi:hypothetical protein
MNIALFWDVERCGRCEIGVAKERIASIMRVTTIGELETEARYGIHGLLRG